MRPIDVLIVGAGPAGLATAIRVKQRLNRANKEAAVVVIDKAPKPGFHNLSGAVFESACLDELLPGWRETGELSSLEMSAVERDEMYFLTPGAAWRIPGTMVPVGMHHKGDQVISLSLLVDCLYKAARKEGVEVYSGFAVNSIIWDKETVRGVRLVDCGLDKDRKIKSNFLEGEKLLARVTVLASGAMGGLAKEYLSAVKGNVNPQVYSIGVKQILRVKSGNNFGDHRVIHTLGYPNCLDVFGGGFFYSMGREHIAAGLILGLDWRYADLNPQKELELLKTHPFVAGLLQRTELVATGAKIIPEGGFYSLPRLWTEGAVIVGDAAGFVNMEKIKGINYAVLSGIAAADAIAEGYIQNDLSVRSLAVYEANLEARGVLKDLRQARNFRQVFQWGLLAGAPLSKIQTVFPFSLGIKEDHTKTLKSAKLDRPCDLAVNRSMFAALSGTGHREDAPSHISIIDAGTCQRCRMEWGSPCLAFCPTEVYRWIEGGIGLSASNCLHCGTCAVKCPFQNIIWTLPEGGEGPRYKNM